MRVESLGVLCLLLLALVESLGAQARGEICPKMLPQSLPSCVAIPDGVIDLTAVSTPRSGDPKSKLELGL